MNHKEYKQIIAEATPAEVASALKSLRLGKGSQEQQIIAYDFYSKKVSLLSDQISKLDQNIKNSNKEWRYWRLMELVYDLVYNPTLDGSITNVEASTLSDAYTDVADSANVSKTTIERDFQRLKKGKTQKQLKEKIDRAIGRLLKEVQAGK